MYTRLIIAFLISTALGLGQAKATHIKAADISATINPNGVFSANAHRIVRFTLTVYTRKSIVDASGSSVDCDNRLANCVSLDFGDGTSQKAHYSSITTLNNDTYQFIYYFEHTYSSDRLYLASYYDENRNANILNLKDPTDLLPFYVNMVLLIDPALNGNQTPVFSTTPIDMAVFFRTFTHNLGAYDPNGDSISYEPTTPLIFANTPAPGYKSPELVRQGTTQEGSSPATYMVNPVNGDVVWDTPALTGRYNIAVKVTEWRKLGNATQMISQSVRDMQIEVRSGSNRQPEFVIPKDTVIEANTVYSQSIVVNDPENHNISIDLSGELEGTSTVAFRLSENSLPSGSSKTFRWTTKCANIRKAPYQVVVKVGDVVSGNLTPLTTTKSFFIQVKPPRPTGLKVTNEDSVVALSWDKYSCLNARRIKVYRQLSACVGNSSTPTGSAVLIWEGSANDTQWKDHPAHGNTFSYWLVAEMEDQTGQVSTSFPTASSCVDIPLGMDEVILGSSIAAFPNPFQSVLSFRATAGGLTKVELFDTYGNKMMEELRTLQAGDRLDLDVEELPAGLYTYRFTNSSSVSSGKALKR